MSAADILDYMFVLDFLSSACKSSRISYPPSEQQMFDQLTICRSISLCLILHYQCGLVAGKHLVHHATPASDESESVSSVQDRF